MGRAEHILKFPPTIRAWYFSEERGDWYRAATARWGISEDTAAACDDTVFAVFARTSTLDQFVERLRELVGDEAKAKAIAIEILGNDFLKIEDYLGIDIPAYIKALGGDPSKFVKEIPVADVVAGVMKGIGVAPSDPVIVKRMEHAVTVFLTG
ncbi:hypothetical protein HY634_01640, partial [Candidatus Uhrbacteria bacterium]|nr:hypothetical protein [Candidatus Uhrbacteria bacterium]